MPVTRKLDLKQWALCCKINETWLSVVFWKWDGFMSETWKLILYIWPFTIYRVFLENLLFSRAYKLDINHMKGKNVYTCHIYMLWHLRIWLVITKFLSLLLLQERFKLASIFLNTALGAKKKIIRAKSERNYVFIL